MNKRLRRSIFLSSVLLGLGVNAFVTNNVKADTIDNSNETQVVAKEKINVSNISVNIDKDLKQTPSVMLKNNDENHVNSASLNTDESKKIDDKKQIQGNKLQTETVTFNVKQTQEPAVASANVKALRASAYSVQEGWRRNSNGDWIYILSNGQIARKEYSNSWQRLSDSTGWHWFYLNSDGVPYMNKWITDDNDDTYYMNNMGHIDYNRGWKRNDNGDWVFVHSDGKVAKKHYS
ncbi:hypothetical protein HCN73_06365, partial [Lactobacillus crispatus]|uniref:hypothetical protein n=1 Tax=Lactobacillus crispatus TaxID=47770 RepID=UPI003BF49646|nr:hypothetical protein [Lactobacillus crispatus]